MRARPPLPLESIRENKPIRLSQKVRTHGLTGLLFLPPPPLPVCVPLPPDGGGAHASTGSGHPHPHVRPTSHAQVRLRARVGSLGVLG